MNVTLKQDIENVDWQAGAKYASVPLGESEGEATAE